MKKLVLEACVESLADAVRAQQGGADRIELCADLNVGGLTPSAALTQACMRALSIPIMAMVRPREGSFVYSKPELQQMRDSIELFKELGVHGVVLGILTENNAIDAESVDELVRLAQPLAVTFHKAIDDTCDPLAAISELSQIAGIQRVLTSGGAETAMQGAPVLRQMQAAVRGKLTVIAAGKVTQLNLRQVHTVVRADEYHGKRIVY